MVNKMSSGGGVETSEAEKKKKIRELNDNFRQTFQGGQVFMGREISVLDEWTQFELLNRIRNFNDFHSGNDPHKEHDFGTVELNNISYNWKIDYYDNDMQYHSPDKSDPEVTIRVLTIMKVGE
jgi:hypothetical protein